MILKYSDIEHEYSKYWGTVTRVFDNRNKTKVDLNYDFSILEYSPNEKYERFIYTYATCGLSLKQLKNKVEIIMYSLEENDTIIDILLALADYHIKGEVLGLNHTVNFGIPWKIGSNCSFGLLSTPYIEKEEIENGTFENTELLWLIPITKEERDYKIKYGINKLEDIFEQTDFKYLDAYRKSVV